MRVCVRERGRERKATDRDTTHTESQKIFAAKAGERCRKKKERKGGKMKEEENNAVKKKRETGKCRAARAYKIPLVGI